MQEKEEAPLKLPTPRRLWKFVSQHLHLAAYFRSPGDGRSRHKISAKDLLWSILLGTILRQWAFLAIEAPVGSPVRRNLNVSESFGDDALRYFTERLDPAPTRAALAAVLHRAKRNKAFEDCRFVGLALDGTTAGRRRKKGCSLCRPHRNAKNRYGLKHIRHHHERSRLLVWLLTCLALTLERLYRLRYLHRGVHPVGTAIHLLRLPVFGLSIPVVADSSWRAASFSPRIFSKAAYGCSHRRRWTAKCALRK